MKKLLTIALIFMVCCTSALLFAGCESNKVFLVVQATNAAESNANLTDDEGRIIYTFKFTKYSDVDNEMDRKDYEINQLAQISAILYESKFKQGENATNILEGETNLKVLRSKGADITNFSLKTTGTRTATVTYQGSSATFQYTVEEAK